MIFLEDCCLFKIVILDRQHEFVINFIIFLLAIGDYNGHVGLGVKCSKEVATAIRGAIILAKLSIVPVRRGFWGNKIGKPHTVPTKVSTVQLLAVLRSQNYLICGPAPL